MESQLVLIDTDNADWRLDEATCERGRRGVDEARAALLAAASHPATRVDERTAA